MRKSDHFCTKRILRDVWHRLEPKVLLEKDITTRSPSSANKNRTYSDLYDRNTPFPLIESSTEHVYACFSLCYQMVGQFLLTQKQPSKLRSFQVLLLGLPQLASQVAVLPRSIVRSTIYRSSNMIPSNTSLCFLNSPLSHLSCSSLVRKRQMSNHPSVPPRRNQAADVHD